MQHQGVKLKIADIQLVHSSKQHLGHCLSTHFLKISLLVGKF